MKRSVLCGLGLGSAVLALGLVGCGSAGIETGIPNDPNQKGVPLDPAWLNMKDRMGATAAKKAAAKAAKEKEARGSSETPAEPEKKP
ncbi:MAG TPA: hypothetical protein VFF52_02560 [Isosphaeraceae bacterium]|nr:hypothetical protein [Isosphaeraceae bacterium]